jgi:hypothetical protein
MTRRKLLQYGTYGTLSLSSLLGCGGGGSGKDTLPLPTNATSPQARTLGTMSYWTDTADSSNNYSARANTGVIVQWPATTWAPENAFDQPIEYHVYRGSTLIGRTPYKQDPTNPPSLSFLTPTFIDWAYRDVYENKPIEVIKLLTTFRPEGGARALTITVPPLIEGAQNIYEVKLLTGWREVSLGKTGLATYFPPSKILGVGANLAVPYDNNIFSDLSKADIRFQTIPGATHYNIEIAFNDPLLPDTVQKRWVFPASDILPVLVPTTISDFVPRNQSYVSLDLRDLYTGGQTLAFTVWVGIVNKTDANTPTVVINNSNTSNPPWQTSYALQETLFLPSDPMRIIYVLPTTL